METLLVSNKVNQHHVLVTGGCGYIGSHTLLSLIESGYQVTVVDNLSNSHRVALDRVEQIIGVKVGFYQADILDALALREIFADNQFDSVIHFAGLKAVGESVQQPLRYYQNNVQGTVNLCQIMAECNVKKLVFSSSATVYGNPGVLPYVETLPTGVPTNPYGQSKLMVEQVLSDLYESDPEWQISILRYFNPVGAHESGLMGEDPQGIPNNLMPFISQVASGKLQELQVFGDDYPTHDGTGVRDFIHVLDLADGHVRALKYLADSPGLSKINLGTGQGVSVKQLIQAFERINQVRIPYKIAPRRDGDLAEYYADATLAKSLLNWEAKRSVEDMCADTWRWQQQNPKGYLS